MFDCFVINIVTYFLANYVVSSFSKDKYKIVGATLSVLLIFSILSTKALLYPTRSKDINAALSYTPTKILSFYKPKVVKESEKPGDKYRSTYTVFDIDEKKLQSIPKTERKLFKRQVILEVDKLTDNNIQLRTLDSNPQSAFSLKRADYPNLYNETKKIFIPKPTNMAIIMCQIFQLDNI